MVKSLVTQINGQDMNLSIHAQMPRKLISDASMTHGLHDGLYSTRTHDIM